MKDMSSPFFVVEQGKENMLHADLCLNCLQQQLKNGWMITMLQMLHTGRPVICKYELIQIWYSFVNVCIITHLNPILPYFTGLSS